VRRIVLSVGLLLLVGVVLLGVRLRAGRVAALPALDTPGRAVSHVQLLEPNGGRAAWSPSGNDLIVFDKPDPSGTYQLYTIGADGSNEQCVTCGQSGLPPGHKGNPDWSPDGRYVVFEVEASSHPGSARDAMPGFGHFTDLWVWQTDTGAFFQLTNGAASGARVYGALHPRFSHDGSQLAWSELRQMPNALQRGDELGTWDLQIASFVDDPTNGPSLANVQSLEPGGPALYENQGFSPDGSTLVFTSNVHRAATPLTDNQIYTYAFASGQLSQLTSQGYNEHASFTPDGSQIVWMSSYQSGSGGTDFWIMNADGSAKRRLTYFNERDAPEYVGRVWAARSSFAPDGSRFVGYVQTDLTTQAGFLAIITL